jgi:hypothetical protein
MDKSYKGLCGISLAHQDNYEIKLKVITQDRHGSCEDKIQHTAFTKETTEGSMRSAPRLTATRCSQYSITHVPEFDLYFVSFGLE